MKPHANAGLYLVIPILSILSGCLDVNVRTNVSADGSSERVVSMKLGSREVPASAFPVTTDSTWHIEWKETGEKDQKYEYVARKTFASPEELRREYEVRPDTGAMKLSVSLQKRFEWFYTYYDYRETYSRRNLFAHVPVSEYLTKDEIDRYLYGEKSDSLKAKVKMWENRNLFEEFFGPLVAEAQRRNDPQLPASSLAGKKNELFLRLMEAEDKPKDRDKKVSDSTGDDESIDLALKVFADVLHTTEVLTLRSVAEQAWASITEKMEKDKHPDTWTCSLQMPGLLLAANSNTVEGNLITWEFSADQIAVGDYVMQASSRTTNVWAFVVTGGVALLAVLLGILRFPRRRTAG